MPTPSPHSPGAAADLNTAYASNGISNLGNEAVTLSDTTLAVSTLNTLDGHTSGTIDASTITTLTGAAADLNTAYDSAGISNPRQRGRHPLRHHSRVSILNTLDGNTSGTVNANTVSTLTGAAADLNTAYDSAGISNLGNEAVTLSDTTLAVSVLNTLDGNTSGTINANSITTLTGALQTSTPPTTPTATAPSRAERGRHPLRHHPRGFRSQHPRRQHLRHHQCQATSTPSPAHAADQR